MIEDDYIPSLSICLAIAMAEVEEVNRTNGWYDTERTFGEDVALLHSEVSEMLESYRNNDDGGIGPEAADVLIRLLDTCGRYGIDLGKEYRRKMEVNRARGHRHGGKRL